MRLCLPTRSWPWATNLVAVSLVLQLPARASQAPPHFLESAVPKIGIAAPLENSGLFCRSDGWELGSNLSVLGYFSPPFVSSKASHHADGCHPLEEPSALFQGLLEGAPLEDQDCSCKKLPHVENYQHNITGVVEILAEVPLGMGNDRRTEDFDLLLTSAASDGPWSHSLFSLISSWTKKTLFKRDSSIMHHLHEDISSISVSSRYGIIFQKCAMVSHQREAETASVRLLINNTKTPSATNLSDLVLLDNITGLIVLESSGNKTSEGFQVFRKKFLQAGDFYSISYRALLKAEEAGDSKILSLPAQLSFQSLSLNKTQLKALLTVRGQEKTKVSPNHGAHVAGFFIAFLVSLVLTCVIFLFMSWSRCFKWNICNKNRVQQGLHQESKLEYSQFTSVDGVSEEFTIGDQIIDILSSEEPGNMVQALEDMEIATLTRADADLQACRMQISKDIIGVLLKNLILSGNLSPHMEKRMSSVFKKQFLMMETEVQEEYDRKMVALTAECNLEMRKKTEAQCQREMVAMEEAEELLKRVSERSASEYRNLLHNLHRREQDHLRKSLLLKREEDFAKAYRELAIFQRNELHNIFFTQIKSAVLKGDLKLEAAKILLQDYSKIQENIEELMDFLQANKKYHLSKRFGYREYLIQSIQSLESRDQSLLNTATAQITSLIHKNERAGYLDEDQMETLLARAQAEVLSVQHKLENDLKQEKKKLHQKLTIKRRREMMQKQKELQKEQLSMRDAIRTSGEVSHYLIHWQTMLSEHNAALEELVERLDHNASEELKTLKQGLTKKAADELRRIQNGLMTQELLKLNVPWLFLQQILEEHSKDMAVQAEQLEGEERGKNQDYLQNMTQNLNDELERNVAEQKELRHWEQLVFAKLLCLPLSLSEEELLKMRQEFHSCFAQMDNSLALPKIRARVLLQNFQSDWREAEFLKVDQAFTAPDIQQQSKVKKQRAKNKRKVDILKKCVEDKIHIFAEQASEDLLEKVHRELLLERVYQLKAQEDKLGEYVTSVQLHKVTKKWKTREVYTALSTVQGLLLEELSTSETMTKSACTQILESHSPEIEELDRKLEYELVRRETALQQRAIVDRQQWVSEGLGLLSQTGEMNSERQISAVLWQALTKSQKVLELHNQSLREEQQNSVVLEDLLENIEMDTFLTLYNQELRLASYLSKLTMVPVGMLHRLLSLMLPSSSQTELLSVLDAVSDKYADNLIESDNNETPADSSMKRKHQELWEALEIKLRQDLISTGLEKTLSAQQKKESILKKTHLPLMERVALFRRGSLPKLSADYVGQTSEVHIRDAEISDLLSTGEKLFIFRNPEEPTISLCASSKRKKKNFLNSKKASLVTSTLGSKEGRKFYPSIENQNIDL
ncbi:LOW QUALITY PROTEIN: limbin [Phascolarctos cinereus]|uniref:LOW QUALITY PROTEIN: limbin n=1 Tax=Phascolarctos cinereus TaxID=38626 RepID=A0A6P5KQE5_PHACI|nr:LOW QUALITY PROTEIN: limbin [Phascolarctos cinereus]